MRKPFHRHIDNPTAEQLADAYSREARGEWQSVSLEGGVLNYQRVRGWVETEAIMTAEQVEVAVGRMVMPSEAARAYEAVTRLDHGSSPSPSGPSNVLILRLAIIAFVLTTVIGLAWGFA